MLAVYVLLAWLQLCSGAKIGISLSEFGSLPKDFLLFEDSDTILYHDHSSDDHLFISYSAGSKFELFPEELAAEVLFVQQNPYDDNMAYVFTNSKEHWMTNVGGKQWIKFTTPEIPVASRFPSLMETSGPLVFHKNHPEQLLFAGSCVDGSHEDVCERTYYISTGFGKPFRPMTQAHSCIFATNGVQMEAEMTIFCASKTPDEKDGLTLVRSRDFFESDPAHVFKNGGIVTGVELLGTSNNYVIAVGGHFLEKKARLAYVSYDGINWNSFKLGQPSAEVKILDGSGDSVLLAIVEDDHATLFGSINALDDNGDRIYGLSQRLGDLYHVNGVIDYEQVEALAGVIFANVKNNEVHTKYSLNNGVSWGRPLLKDCKENCFVNLHLRVQRIGSLYEGKVLSTEIPGLLIGVGSVGDSLKDYAECDTFISLDGGITWSMALEGPHLYEIGDSGTLITAVGALDEQDVVKYSMDFGKSWKELKLGHKVEPKMLTAAGGSTLLSFILVCIQDSKAVTIFFDFSSVYKHPCKEKDYQPWELKSPEGNTICTMGHKWRYSRRKQTAQCYVGSWHLEPELLMEACPCERHDYECSAGFFENGMGECVPKECIDGKYTGGYQLLHGNQCSVENGLDLTNAEEHSCLTRDKDVEMGDHNDADEGRNDGKVVSSVFTFKGSVTQYAYLRSADETVVVLTDQGEAYISHNQGLGWEQVAPGEEFLGIFPNPYLWDEVFLVSTKDKVVYSTDRGYTWKSFRTPARVAHDLLPLAVEPGRLIFIGDEGCESEFSDSCHSVSYETTNTGKTWSKLEENVNSCEFVRTPSSSAIVCEKRAAVDSLGVDVVIYHDRPKKQRTVLENTVGFAQVDGYYVSAFQEGDSLRLVVSTDLLLWEDAVFPREFHHLQSFTTLSGAEKAMFIYITSSKAGEYGALYKSNSDGRFFALSLDNVNRDTVGYVDFERMTGLEGIIVVNTVSNTDSVKQGGRKALRTMITHNDGGHWDLLRPPAKDSDGKELCKGKDLEKCSLHLHGFTERIDSRDTYSSETAVGMMIGVGNVGEKLENYKDGNTYLTHDGGITWKEIRQGASMWEYGDKGSVIVLVDSRDQTDKLMYSVDLGETWTEFQFSDEKVAVEDISTVPSDTSLNFIIYTRAGSRHGHKTRIHRISFEKLLSEPCSSILDSDDYEKWTPRHPHQEDDCLFGRKTTYIRKAPGKLCHTGALGKIPEVTEVCQCSAIDYECDTNYIRTNDGKCKLIKGLAAPDHSQECSLDDRTEYTPATGYRKLPISSCEGGLQLDSPPPVACPIKIIQPMGGSFLGTFVTFMFIVLVIGAVCYAIFVFLHYRRKFAVIRLDDDDMFELDDQTVFERANTAIAAGVLSGLARLSNFINHGYSSLTDRWNRRSGSSSGAYIVGDDDLFAGSFADDDAAELSDELDYSDDEAGDLANFRR